MRSIGRPPTPRRCLISARSFSLGFLFRPSKSWGRRSCSSRWKKPKQEGRTSAEVLPSCFGFFHLEEQDRLPQLLDGLKRNPKEKDLALIKQRLGVGGLPIERIRLVVPRTLLPDLLPRLQPYEDLGLE